MPRKQLDGAKLGRDVSRLMAVDRAQPPQARPSLMDAVRAFAAFIEARSTLGWTDAMIAAVLTEAGYPIATGTLRSYRKRLRNEGRMASLPASPPEREATGTVYPVAPVEQKAGAGTEDTCPAVIPSNNADVPPASAEPDVAPANQPPVNPVSRRTFSIDPSRRPPDRA